MLARVFIGVGEAAYGSVGLAVVLAVFPVYRRAALTGAFMAGGSFGSVLGVALGGALAVQFGWRWSFGAMAILGLVLVAALPPVHQRQEAGRPPRRRRRRGRAGVGAREARPAAHAVQHPVGDLRLHRQRPAAVHRRLAVRLAAQLPQPRLRPRAGQGRRRRGDRHPVHGRRHDRLRRGHRPAEPARRHPQVDDGDRLLARSRWSSSASASPCRRAAPQLLLLAVGIFFAAGTTGAAGAMVVQPDPRVHPGDRVRHADPGQQPARPGRRTADHRDPGRPVRPGGRHEDRPDGGGRCAGRAATWAAGPTRPAWPRCALAAVAR